MKDLRRPHIGIYAVLREKIQFGAYKSLCEAAFLLHFFVTFRLWHAYSSIDKISKAKEVLIWKIITRAFPWKISCN